MIVVDGHVVGVDRQDAAGGHRVAGIDRQVDQDLFDLAGVGEHRPEVEAEGGGQFDVLADGSSQELLDVRDELIEVEHLRLDDLASPEGEELVGQLGRSLGGPLDLGDVLADELPALAALAAGGVGDLLADEGARSSG